MYKNNQTDITSKGVAAGLLLPLLLMLIIYTSLSNNFGTFSATFQHFQSFDLNYKILSLCLMPGAGLFFYWSKNQKMNQARGTLLATLIYGVVVLYLYFY